MDYSQELHQIKLNYCNQHLSDKNSWRQSNFSFILWPGNWSRIKFIKSCFFVCSRLVFLRQQISIFSEAVQLKSSIGHSRITHLLWWIAIATCARFHHTEAHSSPDANGELHNAKDQNNGAQSHLCVKMVSAYPYPRIIIALVARCRIVLITHAQ